MTPQTIPTGYKQTKLGLIPQEWEIVELGDVSTSFNNTRIPLSSMSRNKRKGVYPYYGANGPIDYIDDYIFNGEYLLIGEDGSVIKGDGTAYSVLVNQKFWCSNHAHVLQSNEKLDSIKFLKYLFDSKNISSYITGAVQPKLNKGNLESIIFPLPTIPEQKAIAEILSSLDDKIELLKRQNDTLENIGQALFKSWFVDFEPFQDDLVESEMGMIPRGWSVGKLGEIIEFTNGYAFKSKELESENKSGLYKVFKMGNIKKGGGFNPEKTKNFVDITNIKNINKYILKKGDVLMAMTDMKDAISLLGHTALMDRDDEFVLNQRVGLLRIKNNLSIAFPYLYLLTNSKEFISNLRGRSNSGVQVNLSTHEIKDSNIVVPSEKINAEFSHVSENLFEKILNNNSQIQLLKNIKESLLPRLMSGKIRVSK